jgi:hypothetical protein
MPYLKKTPLGQLNHPKDHQSGPSVHLPRLSRLWHAVHWPVVWLQLCAAFSGSVVSAMKNPSSPQVLQIGITGKEKVINTNDNAL